MHLLTYEEYIKYCKKNNFETYFRKQSKKKLMALLDKMKIGDQIMNVMEMEDFQKHEVRLDRRRKKQKYHIVGVAYSQIDIRDQYPLYYYLKSEIEKIKNPYDNET